jgi:hypothetical protein
MVTFVPQRAMQQLEALSAALGSHPLYEALDSPAALRIFCERHVFCVWDFMSLLKSLQRDLTCVSVPWTPAPDPEATRLINEIVLGEESDAFGDGRHGSHFEWYLEAMDEIGADSSAVRRMVAGIRAGEPLESALGDDAISADASAFVRVTFGFVNAPLHVRAAVFFYGREQLIPRMFTAMVANLERDGLRCSRLRAYLTRHVEVDGEQHGPLAHALLDRLFDGRAERITNGIQAAVCSLDARRRLWDTTLHALCTRSGEHRVSLSMTSDRPARPTSARTSRGR